MDNVRTRDRVWRRALLPDRPWLAAHLPPSALGVSGTAFLLAVPADGGAPCGAVGVRPDGSRVGPVTIGPGEGDPGLPGEGLAARLARGGEELARALGLVPWQGAQVPSAPRCAWAARDPLLAAYHDVEWGLYVDGETDLFERLTLEVFQTGLSWRTVLVKRAPLREGLSGFDVDALADAGEAELERFLATPGVIRSPRKFAATVHNARAAQALRRAHGSLAAALPPAEPAALHARLRPLLRYFGPSVAESFAHSVGLAPAPHADGCPGPRLWPAVDGQPAGR